MPDPAWFYSSLSQVTAAMVGFIGGFVFLRLQHSITAWKEIGDALRETQMAWLKVRMSIRLREEASTAVPAELRAELRRAWVDLWYTAKTRELQKPPWELALWALLLLALSAVGIVRPLLDLSAPTQPTQLNYLVPWSGIVLAFVVLGSVRAMMVLRKLKSIQLVPAAQREYEREETEGEGRTLGFKKESE